MNKLVQYQLFKFQDTNIMNLSNQLIKYFGGKFHEFKKTLLQFYISKYKSLDFIFYNCFLLIKNIDKSYYIGKIIGPLNNKYENNNNKSISYIKILKFFEDPNYIFEKNDMTNTLRFYGDIYLININKNFKIYILHGELLKINNNKKKEIAKKELINLLEEEEDEESEFIEEKISSYLIIEEIENEKQFDSTIEKNKNLKFKIFQFFKENNINTFNINEL